MFLEADMHTRTNASGYAFSVVKEMVDCATVKGLKWLP